MPYSDYGHYYSTRHVDEARDAYRTSAEQFVKNVEEFLYDTTSPVYMDPHFLAWSVRNYDLSKMGSGRVFDVIEYLESRDSIEYLHPPLPHPSKDGGFEYRVQYTREQFNHGEVPTSIDGTAPIVEEHHVYQVVEGPDDGLAELLDKLNITLPEVH